MIWLRCKLVFKDYTEIPFEFVDVSEVPVKPGEPFGPCLLLPVQALPLQIEIKPPIGWGYWDGICWRLCPREREIRTSDGEAINAKGIAGVCVLPSPKGKPATLITELYETTIQ